MQYNATEGGAGKALAGWEIVIMDDTPDNLRVAVTALRFHGARVHSAANGEEGLELLKTVQPTVILLDIRMPVMDGWTMFKLVREQPNFATTPIIAITAYAYESDKDELLNAGFDGYLSKPFDIFTFVDEIKQFVNDALQKQQKTEYNPL